MNRKTFLKVTAGAALGGTAYLAACRDEPGGLDAPPGQRTLPPASIGLQLYTVRHALVRDMNGTLEAVADAGYTEVEFAGYYDHPPEEVRDLLLAHGLDPVSAHVPIEAFREDLSGVLAAATTVGHRYLILPWLAEEDRGSLEGYRALVQEMNQLGLACQEAGIRFGYHNHEFEFETVDGGRPFDVLLNETDPALVTFELDLFWTTHGGGDVLSYFETHPGRFALCHVKGREAGTGRMVDVGDGDIPWEAIFAQSRAAGFEHFLVEHDLPDDAMRTIRRSRSYLEGLTF
jgi:sugar phosphate isomerase/epimerase